MRGKYLFFSYLIYFFFLPTFFQVATFFFYRVCATTIRCLRTAWQEVVLDSVNLSCGKVPLGRILVVGVSEPSELLTFLFALSAKTHGSQELWSPSSPAVGQDAAPTRWRALRNGNSHSKCAGALHHTYGSSLA